MFLPPVFILIKSSNCILHELQYLITFSVCNANARLFQTSSNFSSTYMLTVVLYLSLSLLALVAQFQRQNKCCTVFKFQVHFWWNATVRAKERERESRKISTQNDLAIIDVFHDKITTSKWLISFYFGNNSTAWIIRMFDFDGAFDASANKMMHLTTFHCMW